MACKEAENVPSVVTGTISLCDHVAYALFDPEATHSFVSEQFIELVGMKSVLLENVLYVLTPVMIGC